MTWHAGDTEPPLTGLAGVNLATATTYVVHVRRPGGGVIARAPALTNAATGAWSLPWLVGELADVGVYESELEVTFSAGRVQTFTNAPIRVTEQLDVPGPPWVPATTTIDGGLL